MRGNLDTTDSPNGVIEAVDVNGDVTLDNGGTYTTTLQCISPTLIMSILDVVIVPSIADEDFPNVVLEAMALGKPVIASSIAGIPEQIIDGETGLLLPPNNVHQLEVAIMNLSHDVPLRSRMGKAAALRSQDFFSAELAVTKYMLLYQNIIRE